jgi:hypothetical protein
MKGLLHAVRAGLMAASAGATASGGTAFILCRLSKEKETRNEAGTMFAVIAPFGAILGGLAASIFSLVKLSRRNRN